MNSLLNRLILLMFLHMWCIYVGGVRNIKLELGGNVTCIELHLIDTTYYHKQMILTVWEKLLKQNQQRLLTGHNQRHILLATSIHARLFDRKCILETNRLH